MWKPIAHAAGILLCVTLPAAAEEAPTLRTAAGRQLLIGTAIQAAHLDDPIHARLIADQFNCVTPGNEMKPDALQAKPGRFTFERADKIVAFAHAHGMTVIGHTLCWHQQSPRWMFEDASGHPLPRETALANLKTHIETVVRHFKGRVKGWDVVNEAVADAGDALRDTPARRAIGDDFVLRAFEFAHAADPDVELYYNDYNIESGAKRDRALRLVREIKAAGLRIDGVGIQGHWLINAPGVAGIGRGVRAFADEGLDVMITELDVDPLPRGRGGSGADLNAIEAGGLNPFKAGLPPAEQQKLADRYAAVLNEVLACPRLTRITIWGTTDGNTWLNDWPVKGRTNHPMLWDRSFRPKPAFAAVCESLRHAAAEPQSKTPATTQRAK